ncbi:MAG: hypothetical protein JSW25_06090 [Thermoplasmata archaeon]|nr:MAG: hypothetical protein JSW25_06090 [Thermoplasmata archaeon]
MVIGGFLSILSVIALPLFTVSGETINYWDLVASPDASPMYIPNSEVSGIVNGALVGFGLMVLMGLAFILEGRGSINLRQYMPWHSEVRATALYSLAAVVVFVGVFKSGSLVAFAFAEPITVTDIIVVEQVTAPGGAVALVIGMLVLLGLLFMVYYNTVLSVYRGGPPFENRNLARFGMTVAFLGLTGVFMLHSMNVMIINIDFHPPAEDIDYIIPYTYADVQYLVDTNQAEEGIRHLDTNLAIMGWSLLICGILGLGGMVGIAAMSLGSKTRRVNRTVALIALASLFAVVALGSSWNARRLVTGLGRAGIFYGVFPQVATPILAGVVISVIIIVAVVLFLRDITIEFVKEAIWPSKEGLPEAVQEGAPKPEVLDVPTTTAPTQGGRPIPWRTISVVVVVLVLLSAFIGYAYVLGPGEGDGGGDDPLDITTLDQYLETVTLDLYFDEGQVRAVDVMAEVVRQDMDASCIFLYSVEVTVTWTDEPDERRVVAQWENQPDTFSVDLQDEMGMVYETGSSSNGHGMTGMVTLNWAMETTILGYGNTSMVDLADEEVEWDDPLTLWVTLEDAGDQTHLVRPDRVDGGNDCRISVVVEGYVFRA